MPQYFSLVTLNGQAKVADAIAGNTAVNITHLAVGDGNGAPVTPLETQTQLVHEVWRGAVLSVSRDPNHPTQVIIAAQIPVGAGPFVVREMGLIAADGTLFAIQNTPEIEKSTAAQGATQDVIVHFRVVVATTANITVTIDPADLVSMSQLLRAPFIAIDSFANEPPANPAAGALVVVGAAPTGGFANLAHRFAQWNGTLWVNAIAYLGTIVADGTTGKYWKRGLLGWEEITEINYPLVRRVIETAGLVYAPAADQDQLAKAVSRYASNGPYYTGGGTANAHVLTPLPDYEQPDAYYEGMEIIWRPAASNTAAATARVGALPILPVYTEAGAALVGGELEALAAARFDGALNAPDGGWRLEPWGNALNRCKRLPPATQTLTLWVRPDGNDATADGADNTAARAFQTINAALKHAVRNFVTTGINVYVRLGIAGTYAPAIVPNGISSLIIEGDVAAQDNYSITSAAGYGMSALVVGSSNVVLKGLRIINGATTNQFAALSVIAGTCAIQNVTLQGGLGYALVGVENCGYLVVNGGNKFLSGAAIGLYSFLGANINLPAGGGLATSAAHNYSVGFAVATMGGRINRVTGFAITGSATGPRYVVNSKGHINTYGGGPNVFPGSVAGTADAATYGLYH